MIDLFLKGGPVMWPLLVVSLLSLTVIFERLVFLVQEWRHRDSAAVARIFQEADSGEFDAAQAAGARSQDYLARILTYALKYRHASFSNALQKAANDELKRFNRGISLLDTIVTLAPLLGLFGTVTGMIHAFSLLGGSELGAPAAITGGIAEALLATAFGLLIAMTSLIPFNFLNTRLEEARQIIEAAAVHLELLLLRTDKETVFLRNQESEGLSFPNSVGDRRAAISGFPESEAHPPEPRRGSCHCPGNSIAASSCSDCDPAPPAAMELRPQVRSKISNMEFGNEEKKPSFANA